jgi:hypothetical protein
MRMSLSLAALPPIVLTGALVASSPRAEASVSASAFSGGLSNEIPTARLTSLVTGRPFNCVSAATVWTLTALFARYGSSIDQVHPRGTSISPMTTPCATSIVSAPAQISVTSARTVPVTAPQQSAPPPVTPTTIAHFAPPATIPPAAPSSSAYGCAAAIAYLTAHAAPGFTFICPGNALGHEAMTCDNYASICPGEKEIIINDPCPIAYMNEASNIWVVEHLSTAPIDPYGPGCPE